MNELVTMRFALHDGVPAEVGRVLFAHALNPAPPDGGALKSYTLPRYYAERIQRIMARHVGAEDVRHVPRRERGAA